MNFIAHRNTIRAHNPGACLLATIFMLTGLGSAYAHAADILPTGGNVVAGSGSINQSDGQMTINQTSNKLAIDWQSFSIGQGNSVTFVQPSASSVALNRVLGSDVSVIQGALNANGQVFLINPNGVLFSPTAQVNVGGMVATTLKISTDDFMAGRYTFEGNSSSAVINQGHITTANGGTIALVAAKITNTGTINATSGNILIGAGSKVTLDFGGPVKIQVEQAALNALIEQGGALRADGGLIYLTAKAASDIVTTVINHTGVSEAQTLATGENGHIYLLGDAENGRVIVAGQLNARAPNGGDGGFIETSAAQVTVDKDAVIIASSANGISGKWLIDPTNITIAATSCTGTNCIAANTIASTLSGGTDVSIATDAASSGTGNITVDAPISWTSNKLTLSAYNNININATLTASQSASLAFVYGQGSTDGGSSTYSVASGAKIYIPDANYFSWKKGSGGTTTNLVFNNSQLRFGNGTEASIDSNGQLKQPYYFDNTSVVNGATRNGWFKLTYSSYPLDMQVADGGDGSNSWNTNGSVVNTQTGSYSSAITSGSRNLEISGYKEGSGSVIATETLSVGGIPLRVSNTFTLNTGATYVKTDTFITNLDASNTAANVRLWVGTRDDWVAQSDRPYKFKGNITTDGFVQIDNAATQAKALQITERNDGQGAAVLFYSISAGADTAINSCCSFSSATGTNPRTSTLASGSTDGSYALFIRLADLAPGASDGMTWYYAAAPVAEITAAVTQVSQSAGVTPTPEPEPAPTPTPTPAPAPTPVVIETPRTVVEPASTYTAAVHAAQSHAVTTQNTANTNSVIATVTTNAALITAPAQLNTNVVSGLQLVELPSHEATPTTARNENTSSESHEGETTQTHSVLAQNGSTSAFDLFKVFVVDGGVRMPDSIR